MSSGRMFKCIKKQKVLLFFLMPAFGAVLMFRYAPLFGIVMAFQDYEILKGFGGSSFAGLKHFKEFLNQPDFYNALKNTLGMNLLCLTIGFPLVIVFAILMNELAYIRFKKVIQTIVYMPHFVSWVVIAGLFYRMLDHNTGIVNVLREAAGAEKIGFMSEPRYFWAIIIIAVIIKEIGWNSIIFLSALTNIDPSLYEAAMVDGAGRLKRIWNITLPGILPTICVIFILTVGGIISVSGGSGGTMLPNFDTIYNMRNPMVWRSADVIDIYALEAGIRQGYYSYASAIGLAQSIVAFILLYSSNKLVKKVNQLELV